MLATITAGPEHDAFLFALYAATRQAEVAAWGWPPEQQEAFLRLQWGARERSYQWQYPGADHRLILQGDTPVGRILVHRTATHLLLVDIALLPRARGARIGSDLIRELQAEAAAGGKPLKLSVSTDNPEALRLYERLGFHVTGRTDLYLSMEWHPNA